jgi:hypothetical protein
MHKVNLCCDGKKYVCDQIASRGAKRYIKTALSMNVAPFPISSILPSSEVEPKSAAEFILKTLKYFCLEILT